MRDTKAMRFPLLLTAALSIPLTSCWTFMSDDTDDWCSCSYGDTDCSGYDLLALCEDGCEYSFYDCYDVCLEAGYGRSIGCDFDTDTDQHACLCTDETACDCSAGATDCWDSSTLLTCDDGCFWTGYDCDDLCAASGWDSSSGCGYDFSAGEDTCFCEDDPSCDCSSGETYCSSTYSISSCDDGCYWSVYDCDDVCVDAGWDHSSGCGWDSSSGEDTCFCEMNPMCDCTSGDLECWDSTSIASCDDGCYWSVYDCDDVCIDSGWSTSTGCGWDSSSGDDACFCS